MGSRPLRSRDPIRREKECRAPPYAPRWGAPFVFTWSQWARRLVRCLPRLTHCSWPQTPAVEHIAHHFTTSEPGPVTFVFYFHEEESGTIRSPNPLQPGTTSLDPISWAHRTPNTTQPGPVAPFQTLHPIGSEIHLDIAVDRKLRQLAFTQRAKREAKRSGNSTST